MNNIKEKILYKIGKLQKELQEDLENFMKKSMAEVYSGK